MDFKTDEDSQIGITDKTTRHRALQNLHLLDLPQKVEICGVGSILPDVNVFFFLGFICIGRGGNTQGNVVFTM